MRLINNKFGSAKLNEAIMDVVGSYKIMSDTVMKRSTVDRRSGIDRREAYSLDYFIEGGIERRRQLERRKQGERRDDWVRVSKWCSVYLGKIY